MNQSEIKVGGVYSNGKGKLRKVADGGSDIGGCFVQYTALESNKECECSLATFLAWAKERVDDE